MIRVLVLAGLCLLAAACASVTAPDATDQAFVYRCAGGKRFTVSYDLTGKRALISAGGATRSLPLARSGSGARYAKGAAELWGKGTSATLKGFPGGPYDACATS